MPPKPAPQDGHDNENARKKKPHRKRTVVELTTSIQMTGLCVGVVRANGIAEDTGRKVWAVVSEKDEILLKVDGGKIIAEDAVAYYKSGNMDLLKPKLKVLRTKAMVLKEAHITGFISELEFIEIRHDMRLLPYAYAICRAHGMLHGIPEPDEEKNLLPKTYLQDVKVAKRALKQLLSLFEDFKHTLNAASVARAAGYLKRHQGVFPKELTDASADADPYRFDLYVYKASGHFWQPEETTNKGKKKGGLLDIYDSQKRTTDEYASVYEVGNLPEPITRDFMHNHPPILCSIKDVLQLSAASLVHSVLPRGKPERAKVARKGYTNPMDKLIPTPVGSDLHVGLHDEETLFLGPVLFTPNWRQVMCRYLGKDQFVPPLPVAKVPAFPVLQFTLANGQRRREYFDYVTKLKAYGSTALAQSMLEQLKANVTDQTKFDTWKHAIDTCIEDNEFEVGTDEWKRTKLYRPDAPKPDCVVDEPSESDSSGEE